MLYLLRAAWWKIRPPPIMSPYLHDPRFARELEAGLAVHACRGGQLIAFGHLHGWTTDIIKRNMSFGSKLKVYDLYPEPGVVRLNIWHWLRTTQKEPFNFLYVDVGNTELLIHELWVVLHEQIASGATVLFEGATRLRLTIPHEVIVSRHPGLGRLLP